MQHPPQSHPPIRPRRRTLMHRPRMLVGACGAALAVALAVAPIAGARTQVSLKMQITPNKAGTAKKPKNVVIHTTIKSTQSVQGQAPSASNHVVLYFTKFLKFNGKYFPFCTKDQVLANKCKSDAQVGR